MRRVHRTIVPCSRARLSVLLAGALGALSLLLSAPASARVTEVAGTKVGLQPVEADRYWEGDRKWSGKGTPPESNPSLPSFANAGGHPVLHALQTYLVYWDPQDYYHGDWQEVIDEFMTNLGVAGGELANVFSVDTQYRDATNQPATGRASFKGSFTDTNPYPAPGCTNPRPLKPGSPLQPGPNPNCLTDAQVRAQLQTFIAQHGLPTGMGTAYYLLTPPGVATCLDAGGIGGHCSTFASTPEEIEEIEEEKEQAEAEEEPFTPPPAYESYRRSFCSYHGAIGSGDASTILYGMVPWTAGGAGNAHLAGEDQTQAFYCQDGGFQPGTKPGAEIQEKEVEKKEKTPLEEEEFAEKSPQEKREQLEAEALGLAKPHDQEPNQLGSDVGPDGSYDHGLADLIVNQIATEQHNIVTDPLLNAWHDSAGNEVTDECRNFMAPKIFGSPTANPYTRAGTLANQKFNGAYYYLNSALNMAAYRLPYPAIPCITGVRLVPGFTSPNPVNAGELVGFDGMQSDITLNATTSYPSESNTYATFAWDFGDGSPVVTGFAPGGPSVNSPGAAPCEAPWLAPCAGSTFHAYQYGGVYTVTLSVTDVAGNVAHVEKTVAVNGPPRPAGAGGSSGSSSASATGITGGVNAGPAPTAAIVIVSRSLRSALRRGLVVRYSVNERVTGRFEVLLAKSVAKKIGLRAPNATGLAPRTPAQTLIGKSILVTTTGGRGQARIAFSKSNVAKLRKLHGATLMVRLVVRNRSNASATVLSQSKLGA